jgi:hypothetical protein
VELFPPPWPLGSDREWGDFKLTYGMSESGTILLEFVDFCHDLPDDFCPGFLRTLYTAYEMVDYTLSPIT